MTEEYPIKGSNRDRNVAARRAQMPVNGKSVFTIQHAIEKRATEQKRSKTK